MPRRVWCFVTVRLLRERGLDSARCRLLATSSHLPIIRRVLLYLLDPCPPEHLRLRDFSPASCPGCPLRIHRTEKIGERSRTYSLGYPRPPRGGTMIEEAAFIGLDRG